MTAWISFSGTIQGYWGKLSSFRIVELRAELNAQLYETCGEICEWVEQRFSVKYPAQGMCDLVYRIGYVYKKTKQIPMKVDEAGQAAFIAEFEELQRTKTADEVHYFIDAVHPTLNSQTSYGWIEKGTEHQILSNSGRTRVNLLAALNANEISDVFQKEYKTINSEAARDFLEELGRRNPGAKRIRAFIDNAGYFKKLEKDNLIADQRIEIAFLPTYAPNLNLIERLWRFLKKKVLKNRFYGAAKGFREKIEEFFAKISDYQTELETLLTLNFGVIKFSRSIS